MTQTKPSILTQVPGVINVGIEELNASLDFARVPVQNVEWRPPGNADPALAWKLAQLMHDARIEQANAQAVGRILAARPMWVDIALRADAVLQPLRHTRLLLHAGAPVAWEDMCGPMQGAMIGALLYEGWASAAQEARAMLERGEIAFAQCHDLGAVGPMAGIISPSMPLIVVHNAEHGNVAYTTLNEGIGRCLRFGAHSADVLHRLRWFEAVLAPTLKAAVQHHVDKTGAGVDLKTIQAQALLMGDEVHSRNAAATSLFFMQVATSLSANTLVPHDHIGQTLEFIAQNSQFFLNYSMASCKAVMDAAHNITHSSVVTATARNGCTTALRVSGMGSAWFASPSDTAQGLFFPGYTQADACADLGDSAITETAGLGGCSFAASPALTLLAGGTVSEAVRYSMEMLEVTVSTNPAWSLPALGFSGAPCGIDVRKVVDTGIRPVLTTGIAHRQAGVGQIGAGIVRVPMACYVQALEALHAEVLG